MVPVPDYLFFVDAALDGMVEILTELGDDLANRRPDLPGANSPYAVLTHCTGVVEHWGGSVLAGRVVPRDRDAEFEARGAVADLVRRARAVLSRFEADLADLDPLAPPRGRLDPEDAALPLGRTQAGVLLHVLEELAQHRGQMEVTRDLLRASTAPPV